MKLLFIITDDWSVYSQYQATGIMMQPKKRAVEITLTSHQLAKLNIQAVGKNGKSNVLESIESVSLLKEIEND